MLNYFCHSEYLNKYTDRVWWRKNLVNNKTETIDEIIKNNSIGIDTKLYNEIMLNCIKIIVDRKEIDDKNEIYYPDYNNVNFSSIISKRNEFKIDIPKKN